MAKTHHKKKKQRSQTKPAASLPASSKTGMAEAVIEAEPLQIEPKTIIESPTADFSAYNYVGQELRRIGILAIIFVTLQLILWVIFTHTSVGPSIYKLIKV